MPVRIRSGKPLLRRGGGSQRLAHGLRGAQTLLVGAADRAPLLARQGLAREEELAADAVAQGEACRGMARRHHRPGSPRERIVPPRADGGDHEIAKACPPDLLGQDGAHVPAYGIRAAAVGVEGGGLVDVEFVEVERRAVDPGEEAGRRAPSPVEPRQAIATVERARRPMQHRMLVDAGGEAVDRRPDRVRQRRREAGAVAQHHDRHRDDGGPGRDHRAVLQRDPHALPRPIDVVDGRGQADRQAGGEPREVVAVAPGDEEVVAVFHAREIVQRHLLKGPPGDEAVDLRHARGPGPEPGREGAGGGAVLAVLPGAAGHGVVGPLECGAARAGLPRPRRSARDPGVAVLRRPAQALAALTAQGDEGIDRPGMEPVRAEIDRVAAQGHRPGPAADPVARLQHGHRPARRHERPPGGDSRRARADDHHIRFGRQRREGRSEIGRMGRLRRHRDRLAPHPPLRQEGRDPTTQASRSAPDQNR